MRSMLILLSMLVSCGTALADEKIFDLHVHLHEGEASIPKYLAQLEEAELSVAGFGAMWFGGGNQALAGNSADIRARNDAHLAIAARHKGMMPIATVHPYDGRDAQVELERVAKLGVKVLKLHPHTQKFDVNDPRVLPLVKRAGELNVIVMFDNAAILPGDCENLFNLAIASPKTKFIFAHIGTLNFRFWNFLALARTADNFFADNIYFDLSATVLIAAGSPLQQEFVWTLRNVGVDHVLMGSDFPQVSLAQTLAAFDQLGLTEKEKNQIRYENAQRLFGLK